jgi:hypothetical protein
MRIRIYATLPRACMHAAGAPGGLPCLSLYHAHLPEVQRQLFHAAAGTQRFITETLRKFFPFTGHSYNINVYIGGCINQVALLMTALLLVAAFASLSTVLYAHLSQQDFRFSEPNVVEMYFIQAMQGV